MHLILKTERKNLIIKKSISRFKKKYLRRFKEAFGSLLCPDIQESLLGKYYDPMASPQNREEFDQARAREKCPVAPGLGARLAAEIIIESMEKETK